MLSKINGRIPHQTTKLLIHSSTLHNLHEQTPFACHCIIDFCSQLGGIIWVMDEALTTQIDQIIQTTVTNQQIPGLAIGVVHNGEPIIVRGYGLANVEHQLPTTPDTVFSIASITKLFTATAVFQLIERGKLTLTDSLGQHLPDLPQAWQNVQIEQILCHQSGIKNYTETEAYWKSTRLDISKQDILDLVSDLPLQFNAGTRYAYDNTGFYLLGLLIEKISGQAYGDYLKTHIFDPLQMHNTQANDPYTIIPNRASGYTLTGNVLKNAEYYSPSGTYSAGVVVSTVNDLIRFSNSLYSDQLLSQSSRTQMWTPHPSQENNEAKMQFQVGYGWFLVEGINGRIFAGHNGGMVGFASSFTHYLDNKLTLIALYNIDTVTVPHALTNEIASLIATASTP